MVTVDTKSRSGVTKPRVRLRSRAKVWMRRTVPLSLRKRLAVWVARRQWLPQRYWWSKEIVRDLAERDISEYHRFLWANHLGYAETYEVGKRYGTERVHPSRVMLFDDLRRELNARGVKDRAVGSVLEVGCSMGYLLNHIEQNIFPAAQVLHGVDIDGYAVAQGAEYLESLGSRVRLSAGDMSDLPKMFNSRYDVIICAGVLMYVREPEAVEVVRAMLQRSSGLVALAGLAHPERDNALLTESVPRSTDQSWIHNLDSLVERAGGRVVWRRWEGARQVDGNTIYFVFAEPGHEPVRVS